VFKDVWGSIEELKDIPLPANGGPWRSVGAQVFKEEKLYPFSLSRKKKTK
jgi:hypothetical protein